VDAGADFVITQLFYDNADYFQFRDHMTKLGMTTPIFPGILPIISAGQIKRITALCGAKLPSALVEGLEKHGEDEEAVTKFGIDYATRQCDELLRAGAPGLHMYTLNKAPATTQVLRNLKLTP
jgi:methylenetetrahydrofolate reductase (NADPH)